MTRTECTENSYTEYESIRMETYLQCKSDMPQSGPEDTKTFGMRSPGLCNNNSVKAYLGRRVSRVPRSCRSNEKGRQVLSWAINCGVDTAIAVG